MAFESQIKILFSRSRRKIHNKVVLAWWLPYFCASLLKFGFGSNRNRSFLNSLANPKHNNRRHVTSFYGLSFSFDWVHTLMFNNEFSVSLKFFLGFVLVWPIHLIYKLWLFGTDEEIFPLVIYASIHLL